MLEVLVYQCLHRFSATNNVSIERLHRCSPFSCSISKHLPNYLSEFEFRWNTRKLDDGQRVARAIKQVDGKRLTYRESVDLPPYFVPTAPKQLDAPL